MNCRGFPNAITIICIPLILVHFNPMVQAGPDEEIGHLWRTYGTSANDSDRIETISRLAYYYLNYLDQAEVADSLTRMAVMIARRSQSPVLLWLACTRYIESNDMDLYWRAAVGYGLEALKYSHVLKDPAREWHTCKNIADAYLTGNKPDEALVWGQRMMALAIARKNEHDKAESYLVIGRCLEAKNLKVEALRIYLTATDIAEKTDDKGLMITCYSQVSRFYSLNKLFEKASDYKQKQEELIRSTRPDDSLALIWAHFDLQAIKWRANKDSLDEMAVQQILDFAIRKKNARLRKYLFTLYRTYLMEAEKAGQLTDLYRVRFPEELEKNKKENPALYYRLMALFNEKEGRIDSAIYYFEKTQNLIVSDWNMIYQSQFFKRYGQFYLRHGNTAKAIVKLRKAFELAQSASYLDYTYLISHDLEMLYLQNQDYKNAYKYSVVNRLLGDSIRNVERKDQIINLEIIHESTKKQELKERQVELLKMRNRRQVTMIIVTAVGIVIMTVVVVFIIQSRRKVKKAYHLVNRQKEEISSVLSKLELTNQELEAFTYSVSHDLRAPVRRIGGLTNILQEDYSGLLDAGGKDIVQRISDSTVLMNQLIEEMLKLSRITRQSVSKSPCNLSELSKEIFGNLKQTFPDHKVIGSIQDGIIVDADFPLLRIVMQNLIDNAWKYSSKAEHPEITIGIETKENKRIIFIKDNGVGFDMSHADKLFTPFQRFHTDDEFTGTGIGLATVKRIIVKHGGAIWAISEPGNGAVFYFTLG